MIMTYKTILEKNEKSIFAKTNLLDFVNNIDNEYVNFISSIIDKNSNEYKLMQEIMLSNLAQDILFFSRIEINARIHKNNSFEIIDIIDGIKKIYLLKKIYESVRFLEKYKEEVKEILLDDTKLRKFFKEKNNNEFNTNENFIIKVRDYKISSKSFKNKELLLFLWKNLKEREEIERIIEEKSLCVQLSIGTLVKRLIFKKVIDNYSNTFNKSIKTKTYIYFSKEISISQFSSRKRKYIQHFNLVVSAILSLIFKSYDFKSYYMDYNKYLFLRDIALLDNIKKVIDLMNYLDELFYNQYNKKGLKFLSKDSNFVAIFAAISKKIDLNNFQKSLSNIKFLLSKNINYFDIDNFEKEFKKNVDYKRSFSKQRKEFLFKKFDNLLNKG